MNGAEHERAARLAGLADLRAQLALLPHVIAYEWRKATAFRVGFLLREVLGGTARPLVMCCVYYAMFRSSGARDFAGYRFLDLVAYLVWSAMVVKCLVQERTLDVSEQIFDGYITKFLVMPVSFFTLCTGRWLQFTAVHLGCAVLFYVLGALLVPTYWPVPHSALALLQALGLVLLGGACYFLVHLTLQLLAFWLDVVWSLTHMFQFIATFIAGAIVPIALMPDTLHGVLRTTFPYWTVFAPIEILLGRQGTPEFLQGVLVLGLWLGALLLIARRTWRRGVLHYSGVGA
jgi:ABC-2 type transport system permease protein